MVYTIKDNILQEAMHGTKLGKNGEEEGAVMLAHPDMKVSLI